MALWLADRKHWSLAELVERVQPAEFALWIAFYGLNDPEAHDNWRAGMIASVIANTTSRKGGYKPQDFMPIMKDHSRSKPLDDKIVQQQFLAWAAACGRVDLE